GWGIDELADDYASCARWAVNSGADCIETNFSCPNVATCDGQLYQSPDPARLVAQRIRAAIGTTPLIIKIGHVSSVSDTEQLVDALGDTVDAIAMTNSLATRVRDGDRWLFDRQQRGICGQAILNESTDQVRRFRSVIDSRGLSTRLIGVGGISSAADVHQYLSSGAHACHLATAVMVDPSVGFQIRDQFNDVSFVSGASPQ
ncbi:MAG: hypothetical protein HKN47_04470, partial [Pirellulaceae bacterium]|nr:hypothetical protein [Pirellulaceae bacterium]